MSSSCNINSKDKIEKFDSSSESEDEKHNQSEGKHLETTQTTLSDNNNERKQDESDISKDDSDNSSGNEFQKVKLQKVNRNKYSMRQVADLGIACSKSSCTKNVNSVNAKNKKHVNEQANQSVNDTKTILENCKKIWLNFQTQVEAIERQYNKEDEKQLVLKFAKTIDKFRMKLKKNRKNLIVSYKSSRDRKKSAAKKLRRISDDESSEVDEKHVVDERKKNSSDELEKNKTVSECDSEEIFSANESGTSKRIQTTKNKEEKNQKIESKKSRGENTLNNNGDNVNDEDEMSVDESDMSTRNDLVTSPILRTSKEKKNTEQSSKKQLRKNKNNSDIQLKDKDINKKETNLCTNIRNDEIEDSPLKNNGKKKVLDSDEIDQSNKQDIINESMDMFDLSLEDTRQTKIVETEMNDREDREEEVASENNCSDACSNSLQDKVSNEEKKTSLPSYNNGEKKDFNQSDQNDLDTLPATNEENHDDLRSGKINTDDNESLDDAEALAKETLLETDSDISDTLSNENIATEDSIINNTNRDEEKNEMKDNDSDVNSVSTIMLSNIKETNTDAEKDNGKDSEIETTAKTIEKNDDQLNKESHQETSISDEDIKTEKNAKKALLESNSDDSTFLSLDSEIRNKKSGSDLSEKIITAKLSLLASSSESSDFESATSKINIASVSRKNTKRNQKSSSDEQSIVTRLKKRKLQLNRNRYYKNDEKLRMSCKVHVTRLKAGILKSYSHALNKSREYLEQKALKSLVNLDKLEKKHKKNTRKDSDSLTDDDDESSLKIAKKPSKQQKQENYKEESLMDHLKRIENDDISPVVEMDSNIEDPIDQMNKIDDVLISNEALISEADRIAKENLLKFSDSDEKDVITDSNDIDGDIDKNKTLESKKREKKCEEKASKQDNSKKDKNDWRQDKILTMKFSDTDSETEKGKWEKKQEKLANKSKENNSDSDNEEKSFKSKKKKKKKKTGRRIIDSDSDIKVTDIDSDTSSSFKLSSSDLENDEKDEKDKSKRKKRKHDNIHSSDTDSSLTEKKSKPKRKRIKKMASDSDSSDTEIKNSQGSTPGKSGRKNIRKVLKDKQVAEDTKLAAKEEEERLKRIAERQTLYNEMYEMRLAGEEKVDKLVLDFDTETKKELVAVHDDLVKRLKPHQAQGIKFMWDACFESLERTKNTPGSGCIIAHCMGLGKTLQVIALTHTLLTHEGTNVRTILIVCPLSTVLNWLNEYNTWLKNLDDDIEVYELTKFKKNFERKYHLQRWQKTGGVMIIGYEMFRNLTSPNKNIRKGMKEAILECLVNPGADLIVCDEGHLLKNEDTALSKSMRRVKTMRRIVLTGTPLQNNLIEYHCMVQFVKPNLLGTKKEFLNRFVNPITNGQFDDSTAYDVKLMKQRAHVLHKMLEGSVQRFDYSVLTPFLPPKQEYVIFVRLTDTQIKIYQHYLENYARKSAKSGQGRTLFADFQSLQRIWTHPLVLRLNAEKIEKANEKKELLSDSEGSLKDFINDDSTDVESISSKSSNSSSDCEAIDDEKNNSNVPKRKTRNNPGGEESEEEEEKKEEKEEKELEWWLQFVKPEYFEDMRQSAKLLLLFGILKECEHIGDKVLVFSQSLFSLTLIEEFLKRIDDQTQDGAACDTLDNHTGSWSLGLDYFRLDGQTSAENRNIWCKIFNRPTNTRARLFLISTRAGGLGINLTAANRVIIFDASWNPSHDVQSIFRIYRFGQKKPCYVYRFLAAGTMEEKIYNRQVTKLSLSCRVVDEQQIERHYTNQNLNELYTFEGYNDKEKPTLNLPKDRLLAEIFLKYKDYVENYHEHDSLLENKAEEELNEEERKQAWLEYEEEKKGKPLINPMANIMYQNNILQHNMMINSMQSNIMPQNISLQLEYENLQQIIRKDHPNATPEQQKMLANQVLMKMYNYWEQQAALHPNYQQRPQTSNFQQRPQIPNNSATHQQISQLNQLFTGKSMNYPTANKPMQASSIQSGETLRNMLSYGNTSSVNNVSGNADEDVIEVIPIKNNTSVTRHTNEINSTQIVTPPIDNNKIQEE